MKDIIIDLDGDISSAIADIEELIEQINEFPKALAEIGAESAQLKYNNYQADTEQGFTNGYGRMPVTVTVTETDKGVQISADGEEVVFAEYGTGVHTDERGKAYSDATTPPVTVAEGSYSAMNPTGGVYWRNGYWHYDGKKFYGSYPTYALTETVEELRDNAEWISRSHFK